jgi:Fe-S-cluster containining protein
MNLCNQCGACCRVLTTEQSPQEIQAMAALTSAVGIPSDFPFLAAHWHPLTREEALRRNPFYVRRLPDDAHLYRCDQLGDDGRCKVHATRPWVCRGYPWYEQPVRDMPLADPKCGYAYDQIRELVIRRPDL